MDDTHQSDKNQKMVLKSIAKWLVIFALIAFVCYKNQDLMQEALEEIQITPVWKLVVCLLLGNLYSSTTTESYRASFAYATYSYS